MCTIFFSVTNAGFILLFARTNAKTNNTQLVAIDDNKLAWSAFGFGSVTTTATFNIFISLMMLPSANEMVDGAAILF